MRKTTYLVHRTKHPYPIPSRQSVFSSGISIKSTKHKAARKIFFMDCLPKICCCNYYFSFFFYFYRKPENEIVRKFLVLSFDSVSMDDSLSLLDSSAEQIYAWIEFFLQEISLLIFITFILIIVGLDIVMNKKLFKQRERYENYRKNISCASD